MTISPGQSPNTFACKFQEGPWDGEMRGCYIPLPHSVDVPDHNLGHYVLVTHSDLPVEEDLTKRNVLRGATYHWKSTLEGSNDPV